MAFRQLSYFFIEKGKRYCAFVRVSSQFHILLLPLPHASGTVGYMAPEVIQPGVSYDIEADWFSLGCVIYQFLTGCVM